MSGGAWMERRWLWIPLLAFTIVNLAALSWYGLVYSGYAKRVDQQLENRRGDLARLETVLESRRRAAERLRRNQAELTDFYETRLAPPSERLNDVIREVWELTSTVGLQPSSINYPEDPIVEYGLVKRTFSFTVRGNYAQLRRLINLLELTDSFLTLEEVQLAGRGSDAQLRIGLRLSTLFVDDGRAEPDAEEAA